MSADDLLYAHMYAEVNLSIAQQHLGRNIYFNMGGFIMTMLTRELDPIKEEFVQFYVNTMSLDDLIDLAKTYVYESVEELTEDEFKKHCNDNVDEYIYDDPSNM